MPENKTIDVCLFSAQCALHDPPPRTSPNTGGYTHTMRWPLLLLQRVKVLLASSKPELASSLPHAPKIQSIQCSARLFRSIAHSSFPSNDPRVLSRYRDHTVISPRTNELRIAGSSRTSFAATLTASPSRPVRRAPRLPPRPLGSALDSALDSAAPSAAFFLAASRGFVILLVIPDPILLQLRLRVTTFSLKVIKVMIPFFSTASP